MQAYADQQTAQLQEQLKEKDKLISELVEGIESIISRNSFVGGFPHTAQKLESLIKKASNPEKE